MTIIRYIQGGVLVALLLALGWFVWQNKSKAAEIDTLTAEKTALIVSLRTATTTNEENRRSQEEALRQAATAKDIAEAELKAYKRRDGQLRNILDELQQVPPEQRSPVSPIVCATIDRLYEPTTRPSCVDQGPTDPTNN